jgi:hypothetical protein
MTTYHTLAFALAIPVLLTACKSSKKEQTPDQQAPLTQDANPQIYRYDLTNATFAEPAQTMLLDTATGTVWEMLADQDGRMAGFGKVRIEPAPSGQSTVTGRFRFIASGGKATGTFIVDTATGQVWAWGMDGRRSFFSAFAVEGLHQ